MGGGRRRNLRKGMVVAKYIEVAQLGGMFTYALDECEDYLTLNSYLHIKEAPRFEKSKHLRIFEYYHLQQGGTLNDNILVQLNGCLRQLGRPSLTFVNGHTTSFAALRGQEKITRRQAILQHIQSLDAAGRDELMQRKHVEASRLPERDASLPNRAPADPDGLTRAEVERRRAAHGRAQQSDARLDAAAGRTHAQTASAETVTQDATFVPESTVQDNVVELIAEMQDLKAEVASLKGILQTIFKNV